MGMIGKLSGTFGGKTAEGAAIVECGGVGYAVRVPLAALEGTRHGAALSLYVHTAVREDAIDLYGFTTEEDLSFFKQLMSVKGVGPKTALSILNVAESKTLKRAIAHGDSAALTKVFGIGKKSAERIVVELRDKVAGDSEGRAGGAAGEDAEVIEALLALGYSAQESRKALKDAGDEGDVRTRLGKALRRLGGAKV